MHEATFHNRVVSWNYLVTIAALQPHLILITLMRTILHLLKIPYHTELPNSSNKVALLLPILGDLKKFTLRKWALVGYRINKTICNSYQQILAVQICRIYLKRGFLVLDKRSNIHKLTKSSSVLHLSFPMKRHTHLISSCSLGLLL